MDVRDLAYFEAIARLKSVTRAATEVGRTKPALSKCIRRLEDRVEGALFERRGRRLVLTEAGHALLSHAVKMRTSMADALREVAEVAGRQKGHVRLGVGTSIVETLLPVIAAWHRTESEKTTLKLQTGLNDLLSRELIEDRLDGIITIAPADDQPNLSRQDWAKDDVVVVARRDHPLAAREAVSINDLAQAQWVLAARLVASREWLEQAFISRGFPPPRVQVEVGSAQLVAAFVEGTDLLGFVPRRILVRKKSSTIIEIPSNDLKMHRSLAFMTRNGAYVPSALIRLAHQLRTVVAAEEAAVHSSPTSWQR